MKLDNFKNSPISIVSFIVLTFLFSYLIIGNVEIAGVTTVLSTWIFMMPRLTFENSMYQAKIPKFLMKGDLLNKIISWLIPILLWIVYAVAMQNATVFSNPTFGLLFVIMPIIPAAIQYLILTRSDSAVDWVCPFVMAILTFFGTEFIVGNLGVAFQVMFPFFFGAQPVITQLWTMLLEIFTIYAMYRILSILIPSRTFTAFMTTLLWLCIGMIQKMYTTTIGMSFKLTDVFNIKQFIATLKVLFISNGMPVSLIIQGVGILAAITIVVYVLNKWSTIYDFKERLRASILGVALLATSIFCFGLTNTYAIKNNLEIYNGTTSTLISEIKQKNEFPESFQTLVEKEMIEFGWKEELKPTEPTTPTEKNPDEETTVPTDTPQVVPPIITGD